MQMDRRGRIKMGKVFILSRKFHWYMNCIGTKWFDAIKLKGFLDLLLHLCDFDLEFLNRRNISNILPLGL
jgi:hypothetical protein